MMTLNRKQTLCEQLFQEFSFGEDLQAALNNLRVPLPLDEKERLSLIQQANIQDCITDPSLDRFPILASRYFKVFVYCYQLLSILMFLMYHRCQ